MDKLTHIELFPTPYRSKLIAEEFTNIKFIAV
nr:MAG TPA: hypothetical protein [Caudoviricetes sp.]